MHNLKYTKEGNKDLRSLHNIYTIYSTSTTCFETTNYLHEIILE